MVVLARERVASKTTTMFSLALCDRQNSSRPPLQRNAPDRCRRYGALKVNEETVRRPFLNEACVVVIAYHGEDDGPPNAANRGGVLDRVVARFTR